MLLVLSIKGNGTAARIYCALNGRYGVRLLSFKRGRGGGEWGEVLIIYNIMITAPILQWLRKRERERERGEGGANV
jgi:hypothetical protein